MSEKKEYKKEVIEFVDSLKTLQAYHRTQKAFKDVLNALPEDDFRKVTKNLFVVALHEGAFGQVMHFPKPSGKFKIMQLTLMQKTPIDVQRYVIAHELGHVMQGRNWKESDGMELEKDADNWAKKWGFPRTKIAGDFIASKRKKPIC